MSQIITIHIGGCGINVGLCFWQQLQKQRNSNNQKIRNYQQNTYFNKLYSQSSRDQVPRAIFLDTDIRSNFKVSQNNVKFNSSNILGYEDSCCNIYAEGKFKRQQDNQQFRESLRSQVQKCDLLSGFIVTRAPNGGCGSGVGQNAMSVLSEEYNNYLVQQFKIMPGVNQKNQYDYLNTLQILNICLTNSSSVCNSSMIYTMETRAAEKIIQRQNQKINGMQDVNKYLGDCLKWHILPYISQGVINTSQRKRMTNLIPFYRVKHLSVGFSQQNVRNPLRSALGYQNRLSAVFQNIQKRIYTLSLNVVDSCICQNQIYSDIETWRKSTSNQFIQWVPNNYHVSITNQSQFKNERASAIFNSDKNIFWIRKISDLFSKISRKKAHFHHYTSRGMQQMEFVQAQSGINDLISQYTVYISAVPEDQYQ